MIEGKRLVKVHWVDACSLANSGSWSDRKELDELLPADCFSVGWVHKETDSYIVIYSHDAMEEIAGEFCIPKGFILSIEEIE